MNETEQRTTELDPEGFEDDGLELRKQEFTDWEDETYDSRGRSLQDQDYYDGEQWTESQKAEHAARKQPSIVFNRIAPKINFVLGSEIDSRVSPRAYPRTAAHEGDQEAATDALRYVADDDDFDGTRSEVAAEVLIPGAGGVVFSAGGRNEDGTRRIITETVPFDRLFWDPQSRKANFSDARYMGVITWMDLSEARRFFPGPEAANVFENTTSQISKAGDSGDDRPRWWQSRRKRIQILEHYYEDWDERTKRNEWFWCQYVRGGFLHHPEKSELVDDRGRTWCPILATSAYVAQGTRDENERYGIVRNLIGPQREINYRRSKAIHMMHVAGALYEEGAIDNPNEFQAQLSRVDGMPKVNQGRMDRVQIRTNTELLPAQVQMLAEAKNEIDLMGPRPIPAQPGGGEISGRLFIAQQEAGALELKPVFDHLKRWSKDVFTRYWWMIRQFWNHETWLRVRDDKIDSGYRFVRLNQPTTRGERFLDLLDHDTTMEEAARIAFGPHGTRMLKRVREGVLAQIQQQAQAAGQQPQPEPRAVEKIITRAMTNIPAAQEQITANNVAKLDVDILIRTSPRSVLLEHEQLVELIGMVKEGIMPMSKDLLKVIIEATSLQNKAKLIAMIDKPPPPEEQQAAEQAQRQQQQLLQKQLEKLSAEVDKIKAESVKAQAQAQEAAARAAGEPAATQLDAARAEQARAEAQKKAAEAGMASVKI